MRTRRDAGRGQSIRLQPMAIVATGLILAAGCQSAAETPVPSAEQPTASAPIERSPTSSTAPTATPQPAVAHWESAGTMAAAHGNPIAILLGDGRVLVLEGSSRDRSGHASEPMSTELWDPTSGTWQTTDTLATPRLDFAAVALADGRALVTGGLNDIQQSYSSAYVFDPRPGNETWSKVGLMDTARTSPSAAVLPDGRVLVAGGVYFSGPTLSHDPAPDALLMAHETVPRGQAASSRPPTADVVPDNIGVAMATAELFDPETGNWSLTGPMTYARFGAAAATLADGRILVVGSSEARFGVPVDPGAFESAEIYDPETGQFGLAGELPSVDQAALAALGVPFPEGRGQPVEVGSIVALADGGAVLVGHAQWWNHAEISRSFRFDPQTDAWSEIGEPFAISWDDTAVPHHETGVSNTNASVVRLLDGHVLIAGGGDLIECCQRRDSTIWTNQSAHLYDPATDAWSSLPDMPDARAGAAPLVLPDGSVLFAGGQRKQAAGGVTLDSAIRFVPPS